MVIVEVLGGLILVGALFAGIMAHRESSTDHYPRIGMK
jgi:hypothetical protein